MKKIMIVKRKNGYVLLLSTLSFILLCILMFITVDKTSFLFRIFYFVSCFTVIYNLFSYFLKLNYDIKTWTIFLFLNFIAQIGMVVMLLLNIFK